MYNNNQPIIYLMFGLCLKKQPDFDRSKMFLNLWIPKSSNANYVGILS